MCNQTQREVVYYKGNERSQRQAASTMMKGWKISPQGCMVIVLRPYVFEAEIRLCH